jgi:hypothetical protein
MAIRKSRKATTPQTNEENTVNTDTTPQFEDAAPTDFVEPAQINDNDGEFQVQAEQDAALDTDVDVDAPVAVEGSEDTVVTDAGTAEAPKAEKAKKESTRPPVPEGKVSPVQFAKILSEHKTKQAREQDPEAAEITVAPQVVYSYIKNNGEGSKNPFPATKSEGRAAVVDADAALKWWDAKDARVAASKAAAAEKAAKKEANAAAKANKPAETVAEAEGAEQPALTEAE